MKPGLLLFRRERRLRGFRGDFADLRFELAGGVAFGHRGGGERLDLARPAFGAELLEALDAALRIASYCAPVGQRNLGMLGIN